MMIQFLENSPRLLFIQQSEMQNRKHEFDIPHTELV